MKTSWILMRAIPALLIALLVIGSAHAQSAESVLQKTRDTYGQLKSYADTGVVINEYATSSEDKHTFSTAFSRSPRHFLLDFHKQGGDQYVIWADPDAFHTWWKTTGQLTDYANPNNVPAIGMSGQNTAQAGLKIPTLLWAKAFNSAMLNIADAEVDGAEDVGGHHCHRIIGRASDRYSATGKEVNIRKVTLWIDADSFLIRKMSEEFKALPGQRNRIITTYEPRADATLNDANFRFTPPAQ